MSQRSRTFISSAIRAGLTAPPVMRLKGWLRDLEWSVRGREVVNAEIPASVRSVLFVCQGNICRSPFAERLARRLFTEAGRADVRCTSAGIRTTQAAEPPLEAVAAAASYAITFEAHRPLPVTGELLAAHDLVVVMEPDHTAEIQRQWPALARRVVLLPLFEGRSENIGAFERCHLVDPFGKNRAAFDRCYARIESALHGLIAEVQERYAAGEADDPARKLPRK